LKASRGDNNDLPSDLHALLAGHLLQASEGCVAVVYLWSLTGSVSEQVISEESYRYKFSE